MDEWYFTTSSDEYGKEEFGSYDTEKDALQGILRVVLESRKRDDGVVRSYSEPYKKEVNDG